ncbi:unnamed protein product, partial [Didymodactylos carnosus]
MDEPSPNLINMEDDDSNHLEPDPFPGRFPVITNEVYRVFYEQATEVSFDNMTKHQRGISQQHLHAQTAYYELRAKVAHLTLNGTPKQEDVDKQAEELEKWLEESLKEFLTPMRESHERKLENLNIEASLKKHRDLLKIMPQTPKEIEDIRLMFNLSERREQLKAQLLKLEARLQYKSPPPG